MNLISKKCIFVLLAVNCVLAKTTYFIQPVLNYGLLTSKVTDEERTELYTMLSSGISQFLNDPVETVELSKLKNVKELKADFIVWDIEHYHYMFDDQQREACLQATIYRYSASNNYASPVFAITPPRVRGDESYGDLAPFREGIKEYFKELRKFTKKNTVNKQSLPNISADEIFSRNILLQSDLKIYVVVSPLNERTIGTTPSDYEKIHLPKMVAHFVGDFTNKLPVVINDSILTQLISNNINVQIARVELITNSETDNELKLALYQLPEVNTPSFSISIKDPTKEGWKINADFQNGLEDIFELITQKAGRR